MDRKELLRMQINEYDKIFEKRKTKRVITTIICLSIAFYIMGIWLGWMEGFKDYLLGLIAAPVGAGIYFYINTLIFLPIIAGGTKEEVLMEQLKTELRLLEKGQENPTL